MIDVQGPSTPMLQADGALHPEKWVTTKLDSRFHTTEVSFDAGLNALLDDCPNIIACNITVACLERFFTAPYIFVYLLCRWEIGLPY